MRQNGLKIAFLVCIIALVVISRFLFLSQRPLHHDEGVNYFFTSQLLSSGQYQYDPTNYHGPFYFFSIFASFLLFGISEFSLRFPAAIFGGILVILPLLFLSNKNIKPSLVSLFLLFSPSLAYFSRYSIHESALVMMSMLVFLLFLKMIETKNIVYFPYLMISLALSSTIKETAILLIGIMFLLCLINLKALREIPWRENGTVIFSSFAFAFFIYVAFYTSFFTNIYGVTDSLRGFAPWLNRGFEGAGHVKVWYYYVELLGRFELPLMVLSILGLVFIRKNFLGKNIAAWALSNLIIYSALSYKVPWLIINIAAPLSFFAAYGVSQISKKYLRASLGAISVVSLAIFAIHLNFIRPWQSDNPFAYVHTDKDILSLINKLETTVEKKSKILVVSDEYWPLPFYLRNYTVEYVAENVTIFNPEDFPSYKAYLVRSKYFEKNTLDEKYSLQKNTLRDGIDFYLIINPAAPL